jgi:hypothetical protein
MKYSGRNLLKFWRDFLPPPQSTIPEDDIPEVRMWSSYFKVMMYIIVFIFKGFLCHNVCYVLQN